MYRRVFFARRHSIKVLYHHPHAVLYRETLPNESTVLQRSTKLNSRRDSSHATKTNSDRFLIRGNCDSPFHFARDFFQATHLRQNGRTAGGEWLERNRERNEMGYHS